MSIGNHFYQDTQDSQKHYIHRYKSAITVHPPVFFPAMSSCHMGVQVLDPGEGVPHLGAALHPVVVRPLSGRVFNTGAHMFPH